MLTDMSSSALWIITDQHNLHALNRPAPKDLKAEFCFDVKQQTNYPLQ
jgi:hypothetical protein